ncbi:MAG: class I SAM-dependent methyltransferase [candidate division Zixibacteria bacterium]|nr:class I SAM-dependent methyltransferase [candidate division Zixibacteria bacterium]
MRPTFIDEKTRDYKIDDTYRFIGTDSNQGFRSKLPRAIINRLLLVESEEIEFIKIASDLIPSGSVVLDAGAGQSRYKMAFSHTRYIALDKAIGDQAWNYKGIDINSDLLALSLKSESVDAIICIQVLEHISDPFQFANELHRVLKPGGKLFLSVPQGYGEHQMPYDYFRYSYYGLVHLFSKNFQVNFIRPMGGYFFFIGSWLKLAPNVILSNIHNRLVKRFLGIIFKAVFDYIIPLSCFYLDRLDQGKGITIYYGCYFQKSS